LKVGGKIIIFANQGVKCTKTGKIGGNLKKGHKKFWRMKIGKR